MPRQRNDRCNTQCATWIKPTAFQMCGALSSVEVLDLDCESGLHHPLNCLMLHSASQYPFCDADARKTTVDPHFSTDFRAKPGDSVWTADTGDCCIPRSGTLCVLGG